MDLRAARVASQLLDGRGKREPAAIVRRLLAVQAQDPVAARLALRARGVPLATDVDRALEQRELVAAWLCRGTLHLVDPEDHGWLLALTAPTRFAGSRRRLRQLGVSEDDAERAVAIVERALADEGPLTRPELAERIAAKGIPTDGQAAPHLLGLAALRGVTVLGPPASSTPGDATKPAPAQAFVLARDWIGAPPVVDRDASLAELARRYLAGHGPATAADLAAWSGLPLRDVRAGLGRIDVVEDGDLLDLPGREPPAEELPPRLLGAFDPYLLGWKDRSFAVPAKHAKRVHPGGGMLRATATVDARAVGTWSAAGGDVKLELFARIASAAKAALQADADDVARFVATSGRPS
jgi:hypothetical protein